MTRNRQPSDFAAVFDRRAGHFDVVLTALRECGDGCSIRALPSAITMQYRGDGRRIRVHACLSTVQSAASFIMKGQGANASLDAMSICTTAVSLLWKADPLLQVRLQAAGVQDDEEAIAVAYAIVVSACVTAATKLCMDDYPRICVRTLAIGCAPNFVKQTLRFATSREFFTSSIFETEVMLAQDAMAAESCWNLYAAACSALQDLSENALIDVDTRRCADVVVYHACLPLIAHGMHVDGDLLAVTVLLICLNINGSSHVCDLSEHFKTDVIIKATEMSQNEQLYAHCVWVLRDTLLRCRTKVPFLTPLLTSLQSSLK